jgi:hypothetical protein
MGLAVLLALIAYVVLARFVVRSIEKRTGSKKMKYLAMAVLVLIPTWDVIPGWLYFAYLCRTEGGLKIYRTVELGPQYILQPGQPDRSKSNVPPAMGGEINWAKLREERFANPTGEEESSKIIHIVKRSSSILDRQTGEVLGSAITFLYVGGWLMNNSGPQVLPWECPTSPINDDYVHSSLPKKIFNRDNSAL